MNTLLAQDYTIVDCFDDPALLTDTPTLVRLGADHYLCAVPLIVMPFNEKKQHTGFQDHFEACAQRLDNKTLRFYRSRDGGSSWQRCGPALEFICGHLFMHDRELYYLGVGPARKGIWIASSEDQGESWSSPGKLVDGDFYVAGGSISIRDKILYWTVNAANEEGKFNAANSRMLSVAGDLAGDLLTPAAWRFSDYLLFPGMPSELRFNLLCPQVPHFLEPNTILVNSRLKVLARVRIDDQATAHIAAVCDLRDDNGRLCLEFKQYYPVPGAQNQFYITYDAPSRLHWMTANLPVCTQGDFSFPKADSLNYYCKGNDRRFLWLFYGMDGLNWFPAGCIARGEKPAQAFNYCSSIVDGDDLLVVSRTARDMQDQHNNDLVTFHRITNFRRLAMAML